MRILGHPCEFHLRLEAIVSKVGCVHTRLQPHELERRRRLTELRCLPINVVFLEECGYVLEDFSATAVPAGSEVLELDGMPG